MNISLSVRVNTVGSNLWGDSVVERDLEIKTARDSDLDLPWAQICAGLIESAIRERLEAEEPEEKEENEA